MFLKEKLNLILSVEKTEITHATDRARFLGYDISISKSQEVTKRQGRKVRGYSGAVDVLQTLVIALGAGLGIWGMINLLEDYGNDKPGANAHVR